MTAAAILTFKKYLYLRGILRLTTFSLHVDVVESASDEYNF